MPHRVFVTGANGNIGIRMVRALVGQGAEVVGMARTAENAAAVKAAGASDCLVGDLCSIDVMAAGCGQAETVFHLAGGLRGPGSETAARINRDGAANLAEAIARVDKPPQKIIFASTWLVYGDRSDLWIDETYGVNPQTAYASSKAEAERILLDVGELRGVHVSIARLAAVYGPNFPILMLPLIRRGCAWLPGEGLDRMPMIHVDDAVAALLTISQGGLAGQVYHVAGRDQPTIGEFYREVARLAGGRPPHFWSTYLPSYLQLRLAGVAEQVVARTPYTPRLTPDLLRIFTSSLRMKVDRLEKELGFEWRHPTIQEGLADLLGTT